MSNARLQAQEAADFLRNIDPIGVPRFEPFPTYTQIHAVSRGTRKAPEQVRPGVRFERPLEPHERRKKRFSAT